METKLRGEEQPHPFNDHGKPIDTDEVWALAGKEPQVALKKVSPEGNQKRQTISNKNRRKGGGNL